MDDKQPKTNDHRDIFVDNIGPAVLRLELKPDDAIVLKFKEAISDSQAAYLKARMEQDFPGRKVLILDRGADIAVLSHNA